MTIEQTEQIVDNLVWKWQFSEKREAFIQVITAAQKQIPKLAKVDVVSQYIEGREMPKLVPVAIRCSECDSIVSIRDNYCSDCGQALNFDFKEGH